MSRQAVRPAAPRMQGRSFRTVTPVLLVRELESGEVQPRSGGRRKLASSQHAVFRRYDLGSPEDNSWLGERR